MTNSPGITGWSADSAARIRRVPTDGSSDFATCGYFLSIFREDANGTFKRDFGFAEITVRGRKGDAHVIVLRNRCKERAARINETARVETGARGVAACRGENTCPAETDFRVLFVGLGLLELEFLLVAGALRVVKVFAACCARFVKGRRSLKFPFGLRKFVGVLFSRRTSGIEVGFERRVFNLKKDVARFHEVALLVIEALQNAAHLGADFDFGAAFCLTEHFDPARFVCGVNGNGFDRERLGGWRRILLRLAAR